MVKTCVMGLGFIVLMVPLIVGQSVSSENKGPRAFSTSAPMRSPLPPLRKGQLPADWVHTYPGLYLAHEYLSEHSFEPSGIILWDNAPPDTTGLPRERISPQSLHVAEQFRKLVDPNYSLSFQGISLQRSPYEHFAHHASVLARVMLDVRMGTSRNGFLDLPLFHYFNGASPLTGQQTSPLESLSQLTLQTFDFALSTNTSRVINCSLALQPTLLTSVLLEWRGRHLTGQEILGLLRDGLSGSENTGDSTDSLTFRTIPPKIIVFGSGNVFSLQNTARRWVDGETTNNLGLAQFGLLPASLSPEGKASSFNFSSSSIDLLVPTNSEFSIPFPGPVNTIEFAEWNSAAAAYLSGVVADLTSVLGPLSLTEARQLLRRSALTIERARVLNAYRLIRWADVLRSKGFRDASRLERAQMIREGLPSSFEEEASLYAKRVGPLNRSGNLEAAYKELRRAFFLFPSFKYIESLIQKATRLNRPFDVKYYEELMRGEPSLQRYNHGI